MTNLPAKPLIEVEALSCSRERRVLFEGLSLRLEGGECVELRGPNGSGKTTLIRALAGLLPIQGRVLASSKIAYLGHTNGLAGPLSPIENLRWYLGIGGHAADDHPIHAALRRLDIGGLIRQPVERLSAGQQRRVALARLLIGAAPVWLLDEPYTALDASGIACVDALLREHVATGGCALVASHSAVTVATRVIELTGERVSA